MRISKRWRRIQSIYVYFAGDCPRLDFSENAALTMYKWESFGEGNLSISLFSGEMLNGYAVGKHWLDVQIQMWVEDIKKGLVFVSEIYDDFPQWGWWLDKVIGKYKYEN